MAIRAVIFDAWGLVLKNNLNEKFLQFEKSKNLPSNFLSDLLGKAGSSMNLLYSGKIKLAEAQTLLEQEVSSRGLTVDPNLGFVSFLTDFRSQLRVNGDVRDALQCKLKNSVATKTTRNNVLLHCHKAPEE